jgi:hypothetical protein
LLFYNVYAIIVIMRNIAPTEQTSIIPPLNYERTPIRLTPRGRRFLGAAAALLTLIAAARVVDAANPDYRFSEQTVTEIADQGDTIWGIAQHIDNINSIDIREAVAHLEATNPNLSDGLSVGEAVERPKSIVEGQE